MAEADSSEVGTLWCPVAGKSGSRTLGVTICVLRDAKFLMCIISFQFVSVGLKAKCISRCPADVEAESAT